jgi:hypothetical protein
MTIKIRFCSHTFDSYRKGTHISLPSIHGFKTIVKKKEWKKSYLKRGEACREFLSTP